MSPRAAARLQAIRLMLPRHDARLRAMFCAREQRETEEEQPR